MSSVPQAVCLRPKVCSSNVRGRRVHVASSHSLAASVPSVSGALDVGKCMSSMATV